MLTTSNDSHIKLWDLNKSNKEQIKPLTIFDTSSIHDGGIFGVDIV